MRATATLLISLTMALGAIGLAVAAPGGGDADLASAELRAASGAVTIANSRARQAVFSAGAAADQPAQARPGRDERDGQRARPQRARLHRRPHVRRLQALSRPDRAVPLPRRHGLGFPKERGCWISTTAWTSSRSSASIAAPAW
jgi:hypothetical protein